MFWLHLGMKHKPASTNALGLDLKQVPSVLIWSTVFLGSSNELGQLKKHYNKFHHFKSVLGIIHYEYLHKRNESHPNSEKMDHPMAERRVAGLCPNVFLGLVLIPISDSLYALNLKKL